MAVAGFLPVPLNGNRVCTAENESHQWGEHATHTRYSRVLACQRDLNIVDYIDRGLSFPARELIPNALSILLRGDFA